MLYVNRRPVHWVLFEREREREIELSLLARLYRLGFTNGITLIARDFLVLDRKFIL